MKKIVLALSSLVFVGCVSSGKYQTVVDQEAKVSKENENLKLELGASQNKVSELSKKLGIADTQNTQMQDSLTEMKAAMEQMKQRKADSEKRLKEYKDLTSKFSKLVNSGKLSVKMLNGRMTVDVSTDILFSSGSAKLSAEGIKAIKEVTNLLKTIPNRNFQIEGHTDNLPIKSELYPSNWELASARSLTVVKTMIDAGLPANQISGSAYADTQPMADNATPEGKKLNRRIAIVIVPDLSDLPGNDEIEKLEKTAN